MLDHNQTGLPEADSRPGQPRPLIGCCCHLTLPLLMAGILTDNHHIALALDDLALFANFLNRRPYFHGATLLV
jgi:hypothetical protein